MKAVLCSLAQGLWLRCMIVLHPSLAHNPACHDDQGWHWSPAQFWVWEGANPVNKLSWVLRFPDTMLGCKAHRMTSPTSPSLSDAVALQEEVTNNSQNGERQL